MCATQHKPSAGHKGSNKPVLQHLKTEVLEIHDLKSLSRQVRKHSQKQVRKIEKSISANNQVVPVIIDRDNRVVDGEAVIEAMRNLGFEAINVIRLEHLSETQLRSLRLMLNRVQEDASWDIENLALELQDIFEIENDLVLTGFDAPEIDTSYTILNDNTPDEELDKTLSLVDVPKRVTHGQIWKCGGHILVCGDATDDAIYDHLPGDLSPIMMFTDPPYNVAINGNVCGKGAIQHPEFAMASGEMSCTEFTNFLQEFLEASTKIMPDGSLLYVCMDWRHMQELQTAANRCHLSLLNLCIWKKTNAGMGSLYRSQHELVFIFKKGKEPHTNNVELGKHGRNRTNVWEYASVNSNDPTRKGDLALHPTVKPTQMVTDALLDVTSRGDWIIDPFGGSGTSMLAAEAAGRRAVLIELDEHYCDVILARFESQTGCVPILVANATVHDPQDTALGNKPPKTKKMV